MKWLCLECDRLIGEGGGHEENCSSRTPPIQPAPRPNEQPAVWELVIAEMQQRDQLGRKRYGTPLQPFNGRDALRDALDEALDLCVYLRTAIYERDGK